MVLRLIVLATASKTSRTTTSTPPPSIMLVNILLQLAQLPAELQIAPLHEAVFAPKPVVEFNLLGNLAYSTSPILDLQARFWKDSYSLAVRATDYATPSREHVGGDAKQHALWMARVATVEAPLPGSAPCAVPGMHAAPIKAARDRGSAAGSSKKRKQEEASGNRENAGKKKNKEDASACLTCHEWVERCVVFLYSSRHLRINLPFWHRDRMCFHLVHHPTHSFTHAPDHPAPGELAAGRAVQAKKAVNALQVCCKYY